MTSKISKDYAMAEIKQLNTISLRLKRNKRFNRNKNRIFKRKAGYRGYIAGITFF